MPDGSGVLSRSDQRGRTFSACGPFGPWVTSNSTFWFSSRDLFFLMTRRPRRSTLFPSPTLFRSKQKTAYEIYGDHRDLPLSLHAFRSRWSPYRSEEHTPELQSHDNLVSPLLLEKKHTPPFSSPTPPPPTPAPALPT